MYTIYTILVNTIVSYAAGLRTALGGTIIVMFTLGTFVSLALLRTFRRDTARREAIVATHITTAGV